MFTLKIIVLFTVIVSLHYDFCWCRCAHYEYMMDGQCCPMCAAGNHVYRHCTEDTTTYCVQCPEFTYTDEPNNYSKCFDCSVCDTSRGLRVNKACIWWSDTVCEPLEQFYCTERIKDSCRNAEKHSECSPGQYIKQAGTPSTDTVCADCEADTYSDGSFSSCLPHTQCEALGLTETTPGTRSSDRECGNNTTALSIFDLSVIVTLIIIIITVLSVLVILFRRGNDLIIQEHRKQEMISMKKPVWLLGADINAEPNGLEEEEKLGITIDSSLETPQNCLHIREKIK